MKRLAIFAVLLTLVGGGVVAYYRLGGTPETRRETYLAKGEEHLKQSRLNEAIVEFRNAVKADPRSAEARLRLGQALAKKGELRAAYGELIRAVDLKPDFMKARYELAMFQLLTKNVNDAKAHLQKLRSQDRNAFETRYLSAQIALFEKQPEKAIQELNELVARNHENPRIHVDLGRIYFLLKKFDVAEKSFRAALEINPKATPARVALAQLYVFTGNQEKGEDELLLATQAEPENEELLHVVGLFYRVMRRTDEFEKFYLDLLKKKPDSVIGKKKLAELYLAKAQLKKSREYTDAVLAAQPNDADGLFFRGKLYLAENDPKRAADDLATVTRFVPRFAPGFYYYGLALRNLRQLDEAKKSMNTAVELNPNWLPPRRVLAQLYLASGDPALALEESEKILGAQPKDETTLLTSGAAYFRKGDFKKALARFKQAQEVNPKSISARMDTAAVYAIEKKYPQAITTYEEVLTLAPDNIDALNSIVTIYLGQGKNKDAFERAEKHLSKTKNHAPVYQTLGQIALSTKDFKRGIGYLEKAIEINPNLGSAYVLTGAAYAAQGNYDFAIAQYEKVIAKRPKTIQALMMLGILHDKKNQPQKANEYYQKTLDLNKSFYPAANNLAWNLAHHGGNLDLALGLAQKAREANPNDPNVADTLGWIQLKKGSYLSAVSLLKESNEKFKEKNPAVLYHLGMAYLRNGNKSLAAESLSRALALEVSFRGEEEAKKALEDLKRAQS
jgi:putative PEP-CTERM system TPR-repeat lipoprotein